MRVLLNFNSMFYTKWSRWSACSRSCLTRRYRSCKYPLFCGGSVVNEEAYCYVEGSLCEKWYRRSRYHPRKHQTTENNDEDGENTLSTSSSSPSSSTSRYSPSRSTSSSPYSSSSSSASSALSRWTEERTLPRECGVSNVTTPGWNLRIIGGREAQRGKWPWQVVILNRYQEAFCGGTLVGSRWVLTAAHCVRRKLFVRLGEHDLALREGAEVEYKVSRTVIHPKYDSTTVDNDVALLQLPEAVSMNSRIAPACLPEQGANLPVGDKCTIIGWGKERNTHFFGTDVLHEAEVPIIASKACETVYEDYYITSNMFCAGYLKGRVDSCAGDSGGPLLCQRHGRWYIYGITSFGEGCGKKGKFGIYARVSNYRHWIQSVVASPDL
ncbi:trypsin-3-like [Penaeus indicus]|uniref:trypsin-3-like n=1 Tax=Penaeus indicus TaxID=29960 RepID=UPI00300CDDA1